MHQLRGQVPGVVPVAEALGDRVVEDGRVRPVLTEVQVVDLPALAVLAEVGQVAVRNEVSAKPRHSSLGACRRTGVRAERECARFSIPRKAGNGYGVRCGVRQFRKRPDTRPQAGRRSSSSAGTGRTSIPMPPRPYARQRTHVHQSAHRYRLSHHVSGARGSDQNRTDGDAAAQHFEDVVGNVGSLDIRMTRTLAWPWRRVPGYTAFRIDSESAASRASPRPLRGRERGSEAPSPPGRPAVRTPNRRCRNWNGRAERSWA